MHDSDIDTMARKVYDRMTTAAEQLVPHPPNNSSANTASPS